MCPMSKRHEIFGERLIICAKGYVVGRMIGAIKQPHQVQGLKMVVIDRGQGLSLVNLSPHLHT